MNRIVPLGFLLATMSALVVAVQATSTTKNAPPSRIDGHGPVTPFPEAAEQPRDGSKIVVDLTAGGPHDQLNKGLEKVARFVNIYSQAGKTPAHVQICVVLHGDATTLSLNDDAYPAGNNPNWPLLRKLRRAGVEFLVCGQALTKHGYRANQTSDEVVVAVSGLTALVNRQQDGYAYLPLFK